MKFTDNYNLNLPDLADQYNLEHWNANTSKIDEQLKFCENNIENLQQKHQDDATAMNTAIENLQSQINSIGRLKNVLNIPFTETSTGAIIYKNQLVNFIETNCYFQTGSIKVNAGIPLFITFYTSHTHCFVECYYHKKKLYIDRVISQHLSPTITINADGDFIVNIDGNQVTNIFVS